MKQVDQSNVKKEKLRMIHDLESNALIPCCDSRFESLHLWSWKEKEERNGNDDITHLLLLFHLRS